MFRYLLVLVFTLAAAGLYAQSLSGKVRDAKTSEPLPFANVYINNTTVGTAANQNGEYLLKNVPTGIQEIVFSFVGYQTYSTKVRVNAGENLLLNIKLKPNQKQLDNVSVNSTRDKEWEKRMKRFTRVFLGSTRNATHSKILNPWCIELSETNTGGKKELIATSTQPIEIENLDLGYKIFYDLKDFVSNSYYYRFNGNIFFREIRTTDEDQAERWKKNRLKAYQGSTRHFLKSVLDNRVKEEGFLVYAYKPEFEKKTVVRSTVFAQDYNLIVTSYNPSGFFLSGRHPGEFKIPMKQKVEIHYLRETTAFRTYRDIDALVAGLEVTGGYVEVNQAGVILNPRSVITSGYMSESRVAELLPYDYEPGQAADFVDLKAISKVPVNLDRLQEKIYLQTDKSYYYPGEMVWFKGYMKYNYPEKMDSLSAALYVDLIGPDKKILQTKIFSIDSGHVEGNIFLPGSLEKGNYCLRAYTNWMRNYGDEKLFIKPLPIVGLYDNPVPIDESVKEVTLKNQIEIKTHQEIYHVRDSIALSILLRDEYDNPIVADLSVSVTDASEVVSLPEKNIVDLFSMIDTPVMSSAEKSKNYPVEHGISVGGKFVNDKGKPEVMKVQIIQGDFEDMTSVDTDDRGNFWTSGFHFYDSLEFSLRATNLKGKSYGKIRLLPKEYPAVPDSLPSVALPMRKLEMKPRQIQRYDQSEQVRVLNEVVIRSTKIEAEEKRPFSRFGTPDTSISADKFENVNNANLLWAIQGRVAGLRVTMVNGSYVLSLGGPIGFGPSDTPGSSSEPMILIDGMPYNGDQGAVAVIDQLTPSNILRIDVFKFGSATAFGARGANGVIAIYTRNGLPEKDAPTGYDKSLYQLVNINGYTAPKKFKSPSYSASLRETPEPDYRSTIHWQPSLKTNPETGEATISFYAADLETKYRVVVEGVTSTGEPIHVEHFIQILK